ncbi:hypothetical protein SLE2022_063400 [Rubroshorea leprosula]
MILLSMNIRGLGGIGKKREIRDLVAKQKVDVLFVQETKMEKIDRCLCRMVWDSDNFEWVAQPANGTLGGILIIWNANVFKKIGYLEGAGFLGVVGNWGDENVPCYLVTVYSPCDLASKRILWENLSNKICSNRGNWCIAGDFNAIRNL